DTPSSDPLSSDTVTSDSVPADSSGSEEQLTAIRSVLPASLTITDPAGVDNGSVIACNTAAIDKFNLSTISDLVAATDLKLAGSSDFESAPTGGLAALNTTYGATLTLTDVPDVEPAIVAGTVDCGVLPSLTAGIIVDGLIMLQDDKFFAESDELIGLMTSAAGQADVLSIVDAINAKLTTDVIRSLLVKVQENRGQYDVVAKEFLTSVSTDQ
ncbi:MAG: hypothetical protein JWN99_1044, partial [Ilumatobacteraceae bacterium]|nr:hypothetical protein [Ilumatobacteraceae bacterium]